jgi:hypothetical protein
MLVASSPTVLCLSLRTCIPRSLRLSSWSVFQRLSAFRTGKAPTPTMEAGDGSRQAGGLDPRIHSIRLAVPTVSLHSVSFAYPLRDRSRRDASLPCLPELSSALPKQSFRHSFRAAAIRPMTARLSLHLRFAKRFPMDLRGVFSASPRALVAINRVEIILFSPGFTPSGDRKGTRLNLNQEFVSRMPSSA